VHDARAQFTGKPQPKFEALRVPTVVGIEEGYPPGRGGRDAAVPGHLRPAILRLNHQPDARVALGDGAHDVDGIVGGSVIDDNRLPVGHRLRLDAGDGATNAITPVEGGNDHDDFHVLTTLRGTHTPAGLPRDAS
jgi:hypothetical protein